MVIGCPTQRAMLLLRVLIPSRFLCLSALIFLLFTAAPNTPTPLLRPAPLQKAHTSPLCHEQSNCLLLSANKGVDEAAKKSASNFYSTANRSIPTKQNKSSKNWIALRRVCHRCRPPKTKRAYRPLFAKAKKKGIKVLTRF